MTPQSTSPLTAVGVGRFPTWTPLAALILALVLAWANFAMTVRWADQPGALHGSRRPFYVASLLLVSILCIVLRRRVGDPVRLGVRLPGVVLAGGVGLLVTALLCRLPPSLWRQIPFKDDWTELFQQAANGVALLRRGVVVGWNWWFLGGYPTSTDIAQNLGTIAFIPMTLLGDRLGYHVLHAVLFLAVPALVWWDLRTEDREVRWLGTGLSCFFAVGYVSGALGSSGDTNSLVGVCFVGLALMGSRAARLGSRWGGALLMLALTLALYTHAAFFTYAVIYLTIEALYFRDRTAFVRMVAAAALAGVAALPTHWESLDIRTMSASTTPSTVRAVPWTGPGLPVRSITTSRSWASPGGGSTTIAVWPTSGCRCWRYRRCCLDAREPASMPGWRWRRSCCSA